MKSINIQLVITDAQAQRYIHTESNQEIAEQPSKILFLLQQIYIKDSPKDLESAQIYITVNTVDPEETGY